MTTPSEDGSTAQKASPQPDGAVCLSESTGLWVAAVTFPGDRELTTEWETQGEAEEALELMRSGIVAEALQTDAVSARKWAKTARAARRLVQIWLEAGWTEEYAGRVLNAFLSPKRAQITTGPTFFQKHAEGITVIWRRDSRDWWHRQYVRKNGREPPEGWWMDNPNTAAGGQVTPGLDHEFGRLDDGVMRSYFREMEDRYRAEAGLPARGEGWVSETHLYRCVEEALAGFEVLREARPDWLSPQRLDIFVPALGLALEYQGVQHYEPVELFGGEEALEARQVMDERKRQACAEAGVRLIEWRYDEQVDLASVRQRLSDLGFLG